MDRLWIGGSPCSGKSTAAQTIAAVRGMRLYSCDDAFERHAAAVSETRGPTLKKVTTMTIGERLAQPVDIQVEDAFRLYREEFPLVTRDLAAFGEPVVVEGAALLPELLADRNVSRDRAVWVVPTEDFQQKHYRRREWAHQLLASTADPGRAFQRWMRRDAVFARDVAEQARALGYPVTTVDGSFDVAAAVGRCLSPGAGPAR